MKRLILLVIVLNLLTGCAPKSPKQESVEKIKSALERAEEKKKEEEKKKAEKELSNRPLREQVAQKLKEKEEKKIKLQNPIPPSNLKITSSAFEDGGVIPTKYTCDGENISPPFIISGIPKGTKSLVLAVSDPQGEEGKFVHWSVWNIDPNTTEIKEGTVPGKMQGINNYGTKKYEGPCPPKEEEHEYWVELYAVAKEVQENSDWTVGHIMLNIRPSILGKAMMKGVYRRAE